MHHGDAVICVFDTVQYKYVVAKNMHENLN